MTSAPPSSSLLLSGGTIIAYKEETQSLDVIRYGAVLIKGDTIAALYDTPNPSDVPAGTEVVDCTNKIISPGFIDTHRHGWQAALKTLAPNTTLADYIFRYSSPAAGYLFTPEDVYIGQLAGLLEALNAGVTTTLDHAHHIWSPETTKAGLQGSIDSSARVFWGHDFQGTKTYPLSDQITTFKEIVKTKSPTDDLTTVSAAYDQWAHASQEDKEAIVNVVKELNIPVLTVHYVGGAWALENSPEILQPTGILNTDTAVVISHASAITAAGANILRATNQFISITPESEMHYGHSHPTSHLIQDQGSIGVDTFMTFSTDMITQARLWLQRTRTRLFDEVLDKWEVPVNNPMSVNQAFLMATRQGGLALRRPDLGVIRVGAKADLVIFDGRTPALLGWRDPVAAVILHASVGDIEHVIVGGKFVKKDGKLTYANYESVKDRFLASVERIQKAVIERPAPVLEGNFFTGCGYGRATEVNVTRRGNNGYGEQFLH
ncbi:Metallo-dependent hydrolase [Hypoxylon trugodes]|uniref:Metallo-dependent hydrolase n=1 Tax=Hypoxylon trugodes TaxID=326681 RepID=UPI00219BBF72|nr:Metallo-dependent hydrolase [Hypoxylon trugodes]KAI1387336.1 Metallo-dependent hydrolase [Hypoxylon trugodes]